MRAGQEQDQHFNDRQNHRQSVVDTPILVVAEQNSILVCGSRMHLS